MMMTIMLEVPLDAEWLRYAQLWWAITVEIMYKKFQFPFLPKDGYSFTYFIHTFSKFCWTNVLTAFTV
jgi:hypothetical protein